MTIIGYSLNTNRNRSGKEKRRNRSVSRKRKNGERKFNVVAVEV